MKKWTILLLSGVIFITAAILGCEDPCPKLDKYPVLVKPNPDSPFTGPYDVIIEGDPDFPSHTIIRPVFTNADEGKTFPILSWGEGGCAKMGRSYAEMMGEIASYGIIVIADGGPKVADMWSEDRSPGGMGVPSEEALMMGIDYAFDKNLNDPCSPLYGKVDESKVAVSGQSCGGLLTLSAAAKDPRVNVIFVMSSGIFTAQGAYGRNTILPEVADRGVPVIYLNGGSTDVAYAQAIKDIEFLADKTDIPLYWVNSGIGHMADILTDNGGTFGKCLKDWLLYQFFDDATAKNMFVGDNCGYCQDDDHDTAPFTVNKYNGAP